MATKTNKTKDASEEISSQNTELKPGEGEVILKVTGACLVKFGGEKYVHDNEFIAKAEDLKSKGVGYLFANNILKVKDDEKMTREIIERHREKAKKDPNAGKSLEELETGQEIK